MVDVISLGDIIQKVIGGGTPSRTVPEYWDGEIPWASVKDLRDGQLDLTETEEYISATGLTNSAANLIPEGTVVICTRMAVGRAVMTKRPTAINQDLKAIFPVQDVDARYLLFALDRLRPQLESVAVGSTVKGISLQQLRTLKLYVPPLSEQRAIAHILDTLDREIQETSAIIDKLQQVKIGLLDDLLTRGLDEEGDLRDPERNPQSLQNRLQIHPTDWTFRRLGDLSETITSGSRGWARYYADEGAIFIRIGNLTRDHINLRLDDIVNVTPPDGAEGQRTRVKTGDLLISITADLGIIGVIPEGFPEAYVNQHISLVRLLDESVVDPRWVGHYLASAKGQYLFYKLNDSGAKSGLNLSAIASLPIPLPSLSEQHQIVIMLDNADIRIDEEITYMHKLELLKKGLMDDLLTGRVRTTNIDIDAEIDSLR